MKLLLLHLSDSHFGSKNKIGNTKLKEVVNSLKVIPAFDDLLVLFSGDVANSCCDEEYQLAKKSLNYILKGISKAYLDSRRINVLISPGNHDIHFDSTPVSREEVSKIIANDRSSQLVDDYLNRMRSFFAFANDYSSFLSDKFIDLQKFIYGNKQISVLNINSALFSLYKDGANDNDRGLHYIPQDSLKKLDNFEKTDLNITLLHHSPRFFDDKTESVLLTAFDKKIDFCLYGHEHNNDHSKLISSEENVVRYRCGGPLSDDGNNIYNAIVVDLDNKSFQSYKFVWNNDYKCFEHSIESFKEEAIEDKSNYIRKDFFEDITSYDELILGAKHSDVYVFPELIFNEGNIVSESKISDFESLKNKLMDKSFCIIKGEDMCGKSSLTKELFIKYSRFSYPVLFAPEAINGKRISKVIEDTYKSQYDISQYSYSKFLQLNNDDRVAIIDDLQMISDGTLDEFISVLSKVFGLIIFVTDNSSQFDVFKNAKDEFTDIDSIKLKISPMYFIKRKELIEKVVKFKRPGLSDKELYKISELINKSIKDQLNIINLEPNFIVFYVNTYLANAFKHGGSNIFNAVFESNITNQLQYDKSIDVNSTIYILQLIAYHIHKNKDYPLSQTKFSSIIDDYNEKGKGKRRALNSSELLVKLRNVRILKYTSDEKIVFANNNFLSYFIAKEVLSNYMKSHNMHDIYYISENVCFGINADILLFLCYLINSKEILNHIIKEANEFFKDIKEFSFDKKNITYTVKKYTKINVSLPDNNDRENAIKRIEEQEKKVKGSQRLNIVNIYDYDEASIEERGAKITRGMKYIEILAKTLPDFLHLLEGDEIEKLVSCIYSHPNKLLYFVLKPFDVLFELDTKELNNLLLENGSTENYTDEQIKSFKSVLIRTSSTLILNVLDMATRLSTNEHTVYSLESHDYKNDTNYLLLNAMIYENLGDTEKLGNRLEEISNQNRKNEYLETLLKRIFAKHCTFNSIRYYGYNQHLVDRFLSVKGKNMANIRLAKKK
jgi:predicted phosphodiesterase